MKIKNNNYTITQIIFIIIYYTFLYYLPSNQIIIFGSILKKTRYFVCKRIFSKIGKNVNIERKANFGTGIYIEIGNNSGLGINCHIPKNTIIGNNVMMGPNCYILSRNHSHSNIKIPMIQQGFEEFKQTIIEDDVWLGRNIIMTPGRYIKKGSIVAAGCILCKDFPEYSIIGGNPSKIIRSRV